MRYVIDIHTGDTQARFVVEAAAPRVAREKALRLAQVEGLFEVDFLAPDGPGDLDVSVVRTFIEGIGEVEYDGETIAISTEDGHFVFDEARLQHDIVADFGLELAVMRIINRALGKAEEAQYD